MPPIRSPRAPKQVLRREHAASASIDRNALTFCTCADHGSQPVSSVRSSWPPASPNHSATLGYPRIHPTRDRFPTLCFPHMGMARGRRRPGLGCGSAPVPSARTRLDPGRACRPDWGLGSDRVPVGEAGRSRAECCASSASRSCPRRADKRAGTAPNEAQSSRTARAGRTQPRSAGQQDRHGTQYRHDHRAALHVVAFTGCRLGPGTGDRARGMAISVGAEPTDLTGRAVSAVLTALTVCPRAAR